MKLALFCFLEDFLEKENYVANDYCRTSKVAFFDIVPEVLKDAINLIGMILIEDAKVCNWFEMLFPVLQWQLHILFDLVDELLEISVIWELLQVFKGNEFGLFDHLIWSRESIHHLLLLLVFVELIKHIALISICIWILKNGALILGRLVTELHALISLGPIISIKDILTRMIFKFLFTIEHSTKRERRLTLFFACFLNLNF